MKIIRSILDWYSRNLISRWTVFAIDMALVGLSFWVSVLLLGDFKIEPEWNKLRLLERSVVVMLLYGISFLMFRSFVGIIRHTSIADASRILWANTVAAGVLMAMHTVTQLRSGNVITPFNLSASLILTHFLLLSFVMIWSRFMFKSLFNRFTTRDRPLRKVLIYGAGSSGRMTLHVLARDNRVQNRIMAFLDDDDRMQNKSIEGIPIYHGSILNTDFLDEHDIHELVVSIQNIEPRRKKAIVDLCLSRNIQVKVVPPLEQWINGEFSLRQIAPVAIEELLQRDPINLSNPEVSRLVRERVVLVTGAAGSIGSELAQQLMHYDPAQLILVDQAETPLYDLQLNLAKRNMKAGQGSLHFYVADITDTKRMRHILRKHRPQMIYHAAAYKHVPLMEENPMEAVRVNVLGTSSLLHLAREYAVSKFVMVSTDKAVNPTNVMGATKRLAEIIAQAMEFAPGFERPMEVVTTRFGMC